MKWNATSVIASSIVIGIAGFALGKLTSVPSEKSEAERLLEDTQKFSTSNSSRYSRDDNGHRPIRPTKDSRNQSFDEKLASMEKIIRGENPLDRSRALLDWIDSLSPQEFESAVDRFRNLGLTEERMGEYAMLLTAWAEIDPISALAYTKENTRGGIATNTVLTAWASRDPESAIAWATANHEGDDANPYMVGIIRGIAGTDSGRATELLQNLPYSRERGEALAAMMPHLLNMGAESARSWIAELSDERLRDGAIARFAESMAKDDPAGTAEWLLANLSETSSRSVDDVFREWAKTDKTAALDSFEKLPQGAARTNALRGLVVSGIAENPQASADLMNQHPADINDRTVQYFIWHSFNKAPAVAVNQIGLIEDTGRRNRMYEHTLNSWLDSDSSAAKAWITNAKLPDSVLKSLPNHNQP